MPFQLLPTISLPPVERGGDLLGEVKREDSWEKINLDLGIGRIELNGVVKENNKKIKQEKECCFTDKQFLDLYNQIFVYHLICSGLPLPLHLFLPIWMNVFNSHGDTICSMYPSFSGFRCSSSDSRGVMDPEPGRCRRTDGRKWRCKQNVVPDEKYCKQHMHRGRPLSSRKHVESSANASRYRLATSSVDDAKRPKNPSVTSDLENKVSVSSHQTDFDRSLPHVDHRDGVPAIVRRRWNKNRDALSALQNTVNASRASHKFYDYTHVDFNYVSSGTCVSSWGEGAMDRGNLIEAKDAGLNDASIKKIGSRKHDVTTRNYLDFISPDIGSSPKTVLECGTGDISLGLGCPNVAESKPQRCRRTDGKRWQCRRDALLHQKYCEAHMHRGVKRSISNLEPAGLSFTRQAPIFGTMPEAHDSLINLNIMPASPHHVPSNENSTNSASDATTITDENISALPSQSLRKH